jgi:hypothetical protein
MALVVPTTFLCTMVCVPEHDVAVLSMLAENSVALNMPAVACAKPLLKTLANVIVTALPEL